MSDIQEKMSDILIGFKQIKGDCERLIAENERLKAENEKLKRIEQKAFWWSAEFTHNSHKGKIQYSWEDWCENFRNLVQ